MHEPKVNLPVRLEGPGTKLCAVHGWGKMSIAYGQMPAGTDLARCSKGWRTMRAIVPTGAIS